MSFAKSLPEGLKLSECERGIGGTKSPIHHIPEKDPVQDALKRHKNTNYFKLTPPHMGSKLKVALWASRIPKQFILHVLSAIHAWKQMEHDPRPKRLLQMQHLTWRSRRRSMLMQLREKTKGNKGESAPTASESLVAAKSAYKRAAQALDAAKLTVITEGANAFKLYRYLLSNEARQPWEKIVQAQMTKCPWDDIYKVTHDETPTKTWDSFME
jgi:hypothetical protein